MNVVSADVLAVIVAGLPLVLAAAFAVHQQRRRLAAHSRQVVVRVGPQLALGAAMCGLAAAPASALTAAHSAGAAAQAGTTPTWLPILDRGPLPTSTDVPAPVPTHGARGRSTPEVSRTPTHTQSPPPRTHAQRTRDAGTTYVVQPGDSLWSITASQLGTNTSTQDVADMWPLLFRSNREVIGSDPGLVHPGQVLTVPNELRRGAA